MIRLDPLWTYQQADMALFRYEKKLKGSKTRQELLQVRHQIVDRQNSLKRLEQQLKKDQKEISRIEQDIALWHKKAQDIAQKVEQDAAAEVRQVRTAIRQLDEIAKQIHLHKKQLEQILTLAEDTESVVKTTQAEMRQGKKAFDELKAKHDKELETATPELERLTNAVKALETTLDPAQLAQYKSIKKNRINPVALVQNDQCQGCNMALPSLAMRKIKDKEEMVTCENCGRILYMPQEE